MSSLDLLPTILDIAGADVPDGLPGYTLRPLLEGSGPIDERTELISYSNNRRSPEDAMGVPAEGYAVRTLKHHFFWYADSGEMRLYDVTFDPRGDVDLTGKRPDLVRRFTGLIADWKASVGMRERIDIHE